MIEGVESTRITDLFPDQKKPRNYLMKAAKTFATQRNLPELFELTLIVLDPSATQCITGVSDQTNSDTLFLEPHQQKSSY